MTPYRLTPRASKPVLALLLAIFAVAVAGSFRLRELAVACSRAARVPKPGTTGPAVRHLQKMLAHLGDVVVAGRDGICFPAPNVAASRRRGSAARSSCVTPKFVRMLKRAQYGGPGDRRWLGIRRLKLGAKGRTSVVLQKDPRTELGYNGGGATASSARGRASASARSSVAVPCRLDGIVSAEGGGGTLKHVAKLPRGEAGAVARPTPSPRR